MAIFANDNKQLLEALEKGLEPLSGMNEHVAALHAKLEELSASVDGLKKENASLRAAVDLKKQELEQAAESTASQKAATIVAGLGHTPVAENPDDGVGAMTIIERYNALSGVARIKFAQDHAAEFAELCGKN